MTAVPRSTADRHLVTDHLVSDLRGRAISGAVVTTGAQIVKLVLTLGSTVILARMLAPQDFGLVAIAATGLGLCRSFKEGGLATATVQSAEITHAQVSNLFWINLGLSGILGLLVLASAPALAWLFDTRELLALTAALALTFPLEGAVVQHLGLLRRQMRFLEIAGIEVGALLAAIGAGVGMAWWQWGAWSLVGYQLAASAVTVLLAWPVSGWCPSRPTRGSGTRSLVRFGASLTAGNVMFAIGRNADSVLIGRWHGAHAVGLYSRAEALSSRPLELLLSPLAGVVVPTLARIQADPERYRRTFLQVFEALALASFVACGLLLALTSPIVHVLLGEQWEAAAVVFAGFAMTAVFRPLSLSCSWLFESGGRGRDSMIAGSVISGLVVGAVLVGVPYGPAGVAVACSVTGLVLQLPWLFHLAGRSGSVRTADLWAAVLRQLPMWGVVGGATMLTRSLMDGQGSLAQLVVCAPAGLLAGAGFILVYRPSWRPAAGLLQAAREFRGRDAGAAT
jgi:PST family polysaccharide transporter